LQSPVSQLSKVLSVIVAKFPPAAWVLRPAALPSSATQLPLAAVLPTPGLLRRQKLVSSSSAEFRSSQARSATVARLPREVGALKFRASRYSVTRIQPAAALPTRVSWLMPWRASAVGWSIAPAGLSARSFPQSTFSAVSVLPAE